MRQPLVEREWRRVLARLRRVGARGASQEMSRLVSARGYPIIFSIRLVERLLKDGEYDAAGVIIAAAGRAGIKDPLMDDLHSSWLWCLGKRRKALSFALKSAERWRKSYIVHKVGTLYRCMFHRTGSEHHRRQSLHYWRLAHALVGKEEKREARAKRRSLDV